MFCNYPVALPFYLVALALLFFAAFPRYLEAVIKSRFFWLAGGAAFTVGMLLLPSENHLLGDGLTHLGNPMRVFSSTEPLEILLHHLVYLAVGKSLLSYRIVAFVAGLFYLLAIYLISRLGETPLERSIIALAFICLATIQFYYGYVEHYTLLNLFMFYYLYFSWRDIRKENLTVLPFMFFLLAFVSHLSAIVLLPSVYYLYWPRLKKWLFLLAIPIIVGGIIAAFTVGIWTIAVPLLANDFSTYTLFSRAHLSALVMLFLLISPAFFLAFWKVKPGRQMVFTVVTLAGTLCFTVLIDPKIGALRDWDLLAIFAIPLAGLIALRAPRHYLTVVTLMIIIVIRIIPWLAFNSKLQGEFVEKSVLSDLHYTQQYDNGRRLSSWGLILYKVGDYQGAKEAWLQRLKYDPNQINTLSMLAPLLFKMGEYPESYQTYLRMLELQPDNPEYRYRASYVLFQMGDNDNARKMLTDAPPGFLNDANVARLYAGILGATGHHQEAVEIIEKNPLQDMEDYLPYVLAKSCLTVGRNDLARQLIGRALELNYFNKSYRQLADQIPRQ
jgi:tetratricopeptide (TPR) repeat protein